MNWYVVSTRVNQEARAAEHLARQGFTPFLPQYRKTRRHARKIETIAAPLFPGYLFVAFDAARQAWRSVNGTCGVQRLICQGDRPLALPEDFVPELLARRDGEGFFAPPEPDLRRGDQVRLLAGPFADHVATILRLGESERIWLLLDILGRAVTTEAARRDIAAVA